MYIFLGLLAISTATLICFSDKIIEDFFPNGLLAKISTSADKVMLYIDEQDDQHSGK